MAKIVLGGDVHELVVKLTEGADFFQQVEWEQEDGTPVNFPAGSTLKILLGPVGAPVATFDAVLATNVGTFDVDKADVSTVIADKPRRAILAYAESGGADRVWAVGAPEIVR